MEAETRIDTFAAAHGARVVIECDQGSVSVHRGTPGEIRVETRLQRPELVDYRAYADAGEVRVSARVDRFRAVVGSLFSWPAHGPRADVTVTAPADAQLRVAGSNAPVEVVGTSGGVQVRVSNGRVTVRDCEGSIAIETSNGRIELERCRGALRLRSSNGRIEGSGLAGELTVETTNGSVELGFEPAKGSSNAIRTTNGSVHVELEGDGVHVTGTSMNGRREIEAPAGGQPRARLDVRTTNGRVVVRQRAAAMR
jgi:DUF4097 and DUF4098 domain-containing protein YvlB